MLHVFTLFQLRQPDANPRGVYTLYGIYTVVLLSGSPMKTRACGVRCARDSRRDARRALRPLHAEMSQTSRSLRATSSFLLPLFDSDGNLLADAAISTVVGGSLLGYAALRQDEVGTYARKAGSVAVLAGGKVAEADAKLGVCSMPICSMSIWHDHVACPCSTVSM